MGETIVASHTDLADPYYAPGDANIRLCREEVPGHCTHERMTLVDH